MSVSEIESLRQQLAAATSFHAVAVAERNTEKYRTGRAEREVLRLQESNTQMTSRIEVLEMALVELRDSARALYREAYGPSRAIEHVTHLCDHLGEVIDESENSLVVKFKERAAAPYIKDIHAIAKILNVNPGRLHSDAHQCLADHDQKVLREAAARLSISSGEPTSDAEEYRRQGRTGAVEDLLAMADEFSPKV